MRRFFFFFFFFLFLFFSFIFTNSPVVCSFYFINCACSDQTPRSVESENAASDLGQYCLPRYKGDSRHRRGKSQVNKF